MALEGNELFAAQEREGDDIRRQRRTPEPEPPQVAVRWLPIYQHIDNGKRFPGNVLYDDFGEAVVLSALTCDGTVCVDIRTVRIEL